MSLSFVKCENIEFLLFDERGADESNVTGQCDQPLFQLLV